MGHFFVVFDFFLNEIFVGLPEGTVLFLEILDGVDNILGVSVLDDVTFLAFLIGGVTKLIAVKVVALSSLDLLGTFRWRVLLGSFQVLVGIAQVRVLN